MSLKWLFLRNVWGKVWNFEVLSPASEVWMGIQEAWVLKISLKCPNTVATREHIWASWFWWCVRICLVLFWSFVWASAGQFAVFNQGKDHVGTLATTPLAIYSVLSLHPHQNFQEFGLQTHGIVENSQECTKLHFAGRDAWWWLKWSKSKFEVWSPPRRDLHSELWT